MLAPLTLVVEGNLDEWVCRRLLADAGLEAGAVYGRHGKNYIDRKMAAWCAAADRSPFEPWFVLRDLDQDAPAPVLLSPSRAGLNRAMAPFGFQYRASTLGC